MLNNLSVCVVFIDIVDMLCDCSLCFIISGHAVSIPIPVRSQCDIFLCWISSMLGMTIFTARRSLLNQGSAGAVMVGRSSYKASFWWLKSSV